MAHSSQVRPPTATQDSTGGRKRAAELQHSSTLCYSRNRLDLGTIAQAGASGRQPCRVPSRILQLFAASCSVCQCNRVKSRPLSGDAGSAYRTAIKEWPNPSRQHLSVTTCICQPPDVTPPASAACATRRLVIREAQTLPADGHRSWLGVDAKERHQKTKKGVHSFPLSAIGARRRTSYLSGGLL